MKKVFFYGLLFFVLLFAAQTLLGSGGLRGYHALLQQHKILVVEKEALEKKNQDLMRRIWRLQEDWVYIGAVCREQMNMVPPNALIYRFGELPSQP